MKRKFLKILVETLTLFIIIFPMSSCAAFGIIDASSNVVEEYTEDFFDAIEDGDYNEAKTLLHPNSYPSASSLESYINQQENTYDVDFSNGVEIELQTNILVNVYTTEYNAKTYEANYNVLIGNKKISLYIFIVENDVGEGIYNFTLE